MRPYGRRAPKSSTPTFTPDNNRDGRHIEKQAVRRGILGLWMEAGEDRDRFRELLIEHGVLIPKDCGHGERCGCQDLPCGWGPSDA